MWKKLAVAVAVLALGVLAGWWWRGEVAKDTCLDMGGQWLAPGYCNGATMVEFD